MYGLHLLVPGGGKSTLMSTETMFYNVDSIKQLYTKMADVQDDVAYINTMFCNVNARMNDPDYVFGLLNVHLGDLDGYDNCIALDYLFTAPDDNYTHFTFYIDADTLEPFLVIDDEDSGNMVLVFEIPISAGSSNTGSGWTAGDGFREPDNRRYNEDDAVISGVKDLGAQPGWRP